MSIKTQTLLLAIAVAFVPSLGWAQDAETGMATDLHVAMDLSNYPVTNVNGGIGFDFGLKQNFFFHKILGAFVGVDYVSRKVSYPIADSERITSFDIPFGVNFRYKAGFIEEMKTTADVGLYYAVNTTESITGVSNGAVGKGLGLYVGGQSLFEITPEFDMGMFFAFKFGFYNIFSEVDGSNPLSIAFGLAGRLKY